MAASAVLLFLFFQTIFFAYGGVKCPCSGPLSNLTSVTFCGPDDRCALAYTEKDYDRLVEKFIYGRRIPKHELKHYFEPVCISIDAEAEQGEIALVAYDPLKVHVSARSETGSHPDWTKKEFGTNIKVRFCSLWDRRKGDYARNPCELQRRSGFMAQTCWFRTADEHGGPAASSYYKGSKTNGVGNHMGVNLFSVVFLAGIIVMF